MEAVLPVCLMRQHHGRLLKAGANLLDATPALGPAWRPGAWEIGWGYLDGEAGRQLGTGLLAVNACSEAHSGWGLGGEVQVVVDELPPLHEHEGPALVGGQPLLGKAHDLVRDCPDLVGKEGSVGWMGSSGPRNPGLRGQQVASARVNTVSPSPALPSPFLLCPTSPGCHSQDGLWPGS